MGKRPRHALDPDDVLRGRSRPDAAALCALIRSVNPTGIELPAVERSRRYALKSKLQSLLVLRFGAEIDVVVDPAEGPDFVLLRHRPTASTAGHVLLTELSGDARSWVQYQIDVPSSGAPYRAPPTPAPRPSASRRSLAESPPAGGDTADDLLRRGRLAILEYDYETARSLLEQAIARSDGGPAPAEALLDLLVEQLGADTDALALVDSLGAAALAEPHVRRQLAVAAARSGDRDAALAFVKGVPEAHAAAVFAALARHALGSGDTATATRDLAAARERDPGHPDLRALGESLELAAAARRRPLEERVIALVAGGRFAEAEVAARDPALETSKSADLRSALRTLHERSRRARATELVARAEEAHRTGDFQAAIGLLRRALVEPPEGDTARLAELLAAAEAAERARTETIEARAVAGLLGAADRFEGLVAYLGAPPAVRARVREISPRPELAPLDETGVSDTGARARAAVAAVLALVRAEAIAGTAPEAALAHLEPHDRLLQGVRAAQNLRERAESARLTRLRAEARQKLASARTVLAPFGFEESQDVVRKGVPGRDDAALTQGQALLSDATIRHLDEPERSLALALRRRITDTFENKRFGDHLAAMVARGEVAHARTLVELYIAQAEPGMFSPDSPTLSFIRSALDRLIQTSFDVLVAGEGARELVAGGLASALVTERAVPIPELWGMSIADRGGVEHSVGDGQLIQLISRGVYLFVRVIDLSGPPILRALAVVRTPQPFRLRVWETRPDKIVAVGSAGAMLSLSLPDFRVLAWRRPEESPPRASEPAPCLVPDAAVSPETSLVWTLENRGKSRRTLRVFDLVNTRVVHEEGLDAWPVRLAPVTSVPGAAAIVFGNPAGTLELRGADGRALEGGRFTLDVEPTATSPHPHGGLFVLAREPESGLLGAVHLRPGVTPGSPSVLGGLTAGTVRGCATDSAASLIFVLHETDESVCHLIAIAPAESGFTMLYRVVVPCRSMLVADVVGRRVNLLVLGRGLFQGVRLGAEPPELPADREPLPLLEIWPAQAGYCKTCGGTAHSALAAAHRYTLSGSWKKARTALRELDEARMADAVARHFAHLLGLSLLHAGEHDEAHRVLLRGQQRPGPCDLGALLAVAAPLDEDGEAAQAQRPLRDLLRRIAAADAYLAADDAEGAIAVLDDILLWEACEPQSTARLARAMLKVERPQADFQLRKLFALATFYDLMEEQGPSQRELFIRGRWELEDLYMLQEDVRDWLNSYQDRGLVDGIDEGSRA